MPFNFDDVVPAKGSIQNRKDRDWCLMIACVAESSMRHGTSTQGVNIGREAPQDFHAGIRTSDDLLALAEVIEQLRNQVAERLDEILSPKSLDAPPAGD